MAKLTRKALDIFCYLFLIGFTIYMVDLFVTELAR